MASSDFLHFFSKAETDLRAFIGSVIRDPHAREDIFQEVSRTLWEKFDDYDLSRSFRGMGEGDRLPENPRSPPPQCPFSAALFPGDT